MSAIDAREKDLSIAPKNTAAVFHKIGGPISIEQQPTPKDLGSRQALVHILYTGVCHTDLHMCLGDWPIQAENGCSGHEGAGVVVALGQGSDAYVKIGDRVGIKWIASSCLKCEYCRRGFEQNCPEAKCSGLHVSGTFQQYAVTDAACLTPIPANVSLEVAAPILCAGVTVYRAALTADIHPGDIVAVAGAGGGLGHLAVQYVTALGGRVLAIDTGDEKKKLVQQLCPDALWVDFQTSKNLVEAVKAATPDGLGPHSAIIAASGAASYEQAYEYLRPRGTMVPVGLPPDAEMKLPVFWSVFHCKQVKPSYVGNRQDAIEALDLCARGKVRVIYKKRGLSELQKVYDEMRAGKLAGRIVLDTAA